MIRKSSYASATLRQHFDKLNVTITLDDPRAVMLTCPDVFREPVEACVEYLYKQAAPQHCGSKSFERIPDELLNPNKM